MSSLLSNLNDNLSKVLHSKKCTNCESFIEYNSIEYINLKDGILILNYPKCNKKYKKTFR